MKLYVRELTPDQRGELAKYLALCGYCVRLGRERLTKNGPYQPYLEYWERKETSP